MRSWLRRRVPLAVFMLFISATTLAGGAPNKWTPPGTCAGPDREDHVERIEKMLTPTPGGLEPVR